MNQLHEFNESSRRLSAKVLRNKTIISILTAVILAAVPVAASAATTAATAKPFIYGAWIPFWQAQPGQQDIAIHLDSLNELSPFSYDVSSNGTLLDDLNIGNGSWSGWLDAVHDFGEKIIPTIAWFDGGAIYNLLSNTKQRQAEEDTIAALAKQQKFDGIDIDFEGMLAATKPYYSLFIQGLAMRLHAQGQLLTCTVEPRTPPTDLAGGVASNSVYTENYVVLNQYCDEVRVMAYDQGTIDTSLDATKGNGTFYAPVTDPDWVKKVIQQTLVYVNPKKVMLAVPTYGYEYEVSWQGGITKYQRVRAFDYMDAMDRADQVGIEPVRNNADELSLVFASTTYIQESPALTYTTYSAQPAALSVVNPVATTTFFISFPDAQSISDEIALAKQYSLRGVMLFKADGDIDPAIWGEMALH
jgi:spore germination protein YaaH